MAKQKQNHSCAHCGGGGFWSNLWENVRRTFGMGRRTERMEYVALGLIDANPYQPREYVLDEPHQDLKASIEKYGVIVPIIVSRQGARYRLVAGQRRVKAARELGFKYIPAVVRSLESQEVMEVSYLENLHREDLTKIDVVKMFDRIRRRYKIDEGDVAEAMGLDINELRDARKLLDLPVPALEALRAGMINEETAKLVAQIKDPDAQLEVIELVYGQKMDMDMTREFVNRIVRKEASYVTTDDGAHFHAPSCPFAQLIPEDRRQKYYTKKEVTKRGKIPCMQCL